MPSTHLLTNLHLVKGIDPVADAFATTVYSDVVKLSDYDCVMFVVYAGVGTSGTSVVTIEACDDTTPSNTSAIPFHYREVTTGDTEGTLTAASASGFTMTAGSSRFAMMEVAAEDLLAAGYGYVRAKFAESVDSAVIGCVFAIMGKPRYLKNEKVTAIV